MTLLLLSPYPPAAGDLNDCVGGLRVSIRVVCRSDAGVCRFDSCVCSGVEASLTPELNVCVRSLFTATRCRNSAMFVVCTKDFCKVKQLNIIAE